jgi:hypothetical protein
MPLLLLLLMLPLASRASESIQLQSLDIHARHERVRAVYTFRNHSKTTVPGHLVFRAPKTFEHHVEVVTPEIEVWVRGARAQVKPTPNSRIWRSQVSIRFAPGERVEVVHMYRARPLASLDRYREHFVTVLPRPDGIWRGPTQTQVHIEQPGFFEITAWDPRFDLDSAEAKQVGARRTTHLKLRAAGALPDSLMVVFAHDYWDDATPRCESLCDLHVAGECPSMKGIQAAALVDYPDALLRRCVDYVRVVNGAPPSDVILQSLLRARFAGQVGAYPPLVPRIARQLGMHDLGERIQPMRRVGPLVDPGYSDARLSTEERTYIGVLKQELKRRIQAQAAP